MTVGGSRPPLGFERFRRRAQSLLEDRAKLRELGARALARIDLRGARISDVVEDLQPLVRLMNAWVRADYREVPRASIVLAIAGILYFVVPSDLVPDFILAVGFLDDVAVISWVARELHKELEAFRTWEAQEDAMGTFIGRSPLRDD